MGCLIVTIIAGVLLWFDVIPVAVFGTAVFASFLWMYLAPALYFKFGFLKFFYHDFLHWHRPDKTSLRSDELNTHAICKYCGKKIMQDSQHNWFTYGED